MKQLNSYRLALLCQEGKFSCVKASKSLPLISHDHLTRLLIKSDLKCCTDYKNLPKNGNLIFDDTVIPKKYSKQIENCSYVYSSSDEKVVLGLCFILVIYVYKRKTYILDVIIWKKGGPTKNELIRDCLKTLKENELSPNIVLFDKWYNAYDTLNVINNFGWYYVTLCNGNRLFKTEDIAEYNEAKTAKILANCNKINPKNKNKNPKPSIENYKFFGTRGKFGRLNKVNYQVQIIKHNDRYVLTNIKNPLNSVKAWKLYRRRWIIETIFHDLKGFLHLNQCSSRSLKAQKNHIIYCFEAYLYLRENYPDKSIESAHQEFLQDFRKLKPQQIETYLKAA